MYQKESILWYRNDKGKLMEYSENISLITNSLQRDFVGWQKTNT